MLFLNILLKLNKVAEVAGMDVTSTGQHRQVAMGSTGQPTLQELLFIHRYAYKAAGNTACACNICEAEPTDHQVSYQTPHCKVATGLAWIRLGDLH